MDRYVHHHYKQIELSQIQHTNTNNNTTKNTTTSSSGDGGRGGCMGVLCEEGGRVGEEEVNIDTIEDRVYCPICQVNVHISSKHCRQCNKCIETFDHHCQWLNNCIGKTHTTLHYTTLHYTILYNTIQYNIIYDIIYDIIGSKNYVYFKRLLFSLYLLLTLQIITYIMTLYLYITNNNTNTIYYSIYYYYPRIVYIILNILYLLILVSLYVMVVQLCVFHLTLMYYHLTTYQYVIQQQQAIRTKQRKIKQQQLKQQQLKQQEEEKEEEEEEEEEESDDDDDSINKENEEDKKDDEEIIIINNKLNHLLNRDNILLYNSVYNIHQDSVNDISISLHSNTFNQNKPYLCSSSDDGTMKISLIDISSNNINITMKRNFSINSLPLTKCKINNEGTLAVVGSNDNNIYLYSISNARCINTLNIHDKKISSIDLISNYLCTGSDDTTIKLYTLINDNISSSPLLEIYDHENKIKCLKIEPINKNILISASIDGLIRLTNINTSKHIISININSYINDIIWYNNNNNLETFFITNNEGIIYLYHIDGTLIYNFHINNNIINTLKIFNNILIGGSNNGSIYLWYINKNNLDLIYIENNAHDDIINCMEILNINNKIYLFTGSNDNRIKIWNLNIE